MLLPGEDVAAFRRERRSLFHNYRPQTQDEADLVDAMAEHRGVSRRFRAVQAGFDEQAMTPETDAAGRIAEPDGHQRLHSGMDETVHRQRIDKLWHRVRTGLMLMQKLRRQGLVAGAVALPDGCNVETDGRVYGPIASKVIVPIPEPEIEDGAAERDQAPDGTRLPVSTDGENRNFQEQREAEHEAVLPGPMDAAAAVTGLLHMTSGGRPSDKFRALSAFVRLRRSPVKGA